MKEKPKSKTKAPIPSIADIPYIPAKKMPPPAKKPPFGKGKR